MLEKPLLFGSTHLCEASSKHAKKQTVQITAVASATKNVKDPWSSTSPCFSLNCKCSLTERLNYSGIVLLLHGDNKLVYHKFSNGF